MFAVNYLCKPKLHLKIFNIYLSIINFGIIVEFQHITRITYQYPGSDSLRGASEFLNNLFLNNFLCFLTSHYTFPDSNKIITLILSKFSIS